MRLTDRYFGGVGVLSGEMPSGTERLEARLIMALLLLWMLPALLSVVHGDWAVRSFLFDSAIHTRSLVAVPILIVGEYFSVPLLRRITDRFRSLVPDDQHDAFENYLRPALSLRIPAALIAVSIACAYAAVFVLLRHHPFSSIAVWQIGGGDGFRLFSPAGWYNLLVGIPLALCLFFTWLWRLALWSRFLRQVSKLRLLLIPSHPDRAAGLGFLGLSPLAFLPLSVAVSVIMAGMIANRVLLLGESVIHYRNLLIGQAIVMSVLFCAPLMLLAQKLLEVRRRGRVEYSGLARRVGRRFEEKWLNDPKAGGAGGEETLDIPDFSATADLFTVLEHVYQMRIIPIDRRSLGALIAITLLPFLPVALLQLPLKTVVQKIAVLLI